MIEALLAAGQIGGRTIQIDAAGDVECATYSVPVPGEGQVLVRTVRSAISPGTEMTFYGRDASNVLLHRRWDAELRLFRPGSPSLEHPVTFGYRASGEVVESRLAALPVGSRVFGNWRHTEYVLGDEALSAQVLPPGLTHDDGVDLAQMGPICVNAVAFGGHRKAGEPVVVFGAGPVGLITAQVARSGGASRVHVVDRLPARLEVAASLGLDTVDASAAADVAFQLKSRFGAEAIPVAFECTGSTHALNEAIRVVRRRGTVVVVGFYQGEAAGLFLGDEFHHNGVQLVCGQIGNVHPDWDVAGLRRETVDLALRGDIVLGGLPRLTLPVERAADGFAALQERPAEVLQVALNYENGAG